MFEFTSGSLVHEESRLHRIVSHVRYICVTRTHKKSFFFVQHVPSVVSNTHFYVLHRRSITTLRAHFCVFSFHSCFAQAIPVNHANRRHRTTAPPTATRTPPTPTTVEEGAATAPTATANGDAKAAVPPTPIHRQRRRFYRTATLPSTPTTTKTLNRRWQRWRRQRPQPRAALTLAVAAMRLMPPTPTATKWTQVSPQRVTAVAVVAVCEVSIDT